MRPSRSRRTRRIQRNRRTHRGGNRHNGGRGPQNLFGVSGPVASPFMHQNGFPQFGVGPAPAVVNAPAPALAAPVVAPIFQGFPQFGVQNPPQNVEMEDAAPNQVGAKRRTRRHRSRR